MSLERLVARIRLCGGMLLMLYVICHLSNLSLGLWSLQLMEQWRHVIMVPWQSWIGQFLLYGSLGSHAPLGLVSLSNRPYAPSLPAPPLPHLPPAFLLPPLPTPHRLP